MSISCTYNYPHSWHLLFPPALGGSGKKIKMSEYALSTQEKEKSLCLRRSRVLVFSMNESDFFQDQTSAVSFTPLLLTKRGKNKSSACDFLLPFFKKSRKTFLNIKKPPPHRRRFFYCIKQTPFYLLHFFKEKNYILFLYFLFNLPTCHFLIS